MLTLFTLIQMLFIGFLIPGISLISILLSHFTGDFLKAFLLQTLPLWFVVFMLNKLIKENVYVWAQKKFSEDKWYEIFKNQSKKWQWRTSIIAWTMFIPYNYKVYCLSLSDISFKAYFIPAIPLVAVHSAIFAYIGLRIPDFNNSDWISEINNYPTLEKIILITLILLIFFTKALCH